MGEDKLRGNDNEMMKLLWMMMGIGKETLFYFTLSLLTHFYSMAEKVMLNVQNDDDDDYDQDSDLLWLFLACIAEIKQFHHWTLQTATQPRQIKTRWNKADCQ